MLISTPFVNELFRAAFAYESTNPKDYMGRLVLLTIEAIEVEWVPFNVREILFIMTYSKSNCLSYYV